MGEKGVDSGVSKKGVVYEKTQYPINTTTALEYQTQDGRTARLAVDPGNRPTFGYELKSASGEPLQYVSLVVFPEDTANTDGFRMLVETILANVAEVTPDSLNSAFSFARDEIMKTGGVVVVGRVVLMGREGLTQVSVGCPTLYGTRQEDNGGKINTLPLMCLPGEANTVNMGVSVQQGEWQTVVLTESNGNERVDNYVGGFLANNQVGKDRAFIGGIRRMVPDYKGAVIMATRSSN